MTSSKTIGIKQIDKVFKVIYFVLDDHFIILQKCDTNKNGKLEYDEFKEMIMRQKERAQVKLRVKKAEDDVEAAKEKERKKEHRRKNPHLYKKYERMKKEKLRKMQQSKDNANKEAAQKRQ